jgi:hypothetical protein
MLLVLVLSISISIAEAAEPTETLTLACQGMRTAAKGPRGLTWAPLPALGKPQPVSLGLLVDFTSKTVKGFDFGSPELKITAVNELLVEFGASWEVGTSYRVDGRIDRVTGDVGVLWQAHEHLPSPPFEDEEVRYSLKCKPTQRMF